MTDSAPLDAPAESCTPAPAAELPSGIAELAAGFIHEIKKIGRAHV